MFLSAYGEPIFDQFGVYLVILRLEQIESLGRSEWVHFVISISSDSLLKLLLCQGSKACVDETCHIAGLPNSCLAPERSLHTRSSACWHAHTHALPCACANTYHMYRSRQCCVFLSVGIVLRQCKPSQNKMSQYEFVRPNFLGTP